jgi:lysophospholipase L1-like esterase
VPFVFIVIALSIYPSIDLARRIDILNTPAKAKKIYYDTIADIEKTLRAYPEGSSVFIDNKVNDQIPLFFVSDTDFPGKAAIFSINYPSNTVEGRRVYFVENDCRVANKNNEKINWRISSLIVSKYYYEVKKFKDKKVAENAIIMVGNSITALGNWKKYFPAENIENFGIIGDDSYGVLNRLDIVIAKKPSKIFLLIGINDISGGCSNGQIIDNYKLILWKLRQELPNTEVYVQSVLPTNGKFIKNENIKRLNAEIKRITTLNKNTYIDMYVKFLGADGNIKPKYVTDGLHLNEAGYIVWVRELSSFL